jgi:aryl-alcohol dehydrogenase-like predicted oxidoreductase
MQYRNLANTELNVSTVAFGCWAIVGGFNWGHQEEQDSLSALRAAYESGINFFDSAEGYGGGRSEELVSKALGDVRDEIIIATKVSPIHYAPAELRAACERSLRNLNTDWIDLYQLHWPNWDIPIAETLVLLEDLKTEGKIRAYGVSNFGPQDLGGCLATDHSLASNQLAYNLLFRAIEYEILPICAREGISVLCYSPLMQGLLTGKFTAPDQVPDDRARTRHYPSSRPLARHGEPGAEEETFAAVAKIHEIAKEMDQPMAHLTLAWLSAQEGVTSVIVGGRNPAQVHSNVQAADLQLSEETIAALADATKPLKTTLGPNADMWQSGESRIR